MNMHEHSFRIRSLLCRSVFCFLLAVTLQGCLPGDGASSFSGQVLDEQNQPVIDADVTISDAPNNKKQLLMSPWKLKTHAEGKFQITSAHAPAEGGLILEVKKEGYEPYQKQYAAGSVYANLIINLKPKDESEPKVPEQ
ncbi:hypothetical protein Pan153_17870 [Gimesia panareensis]|uniref:Carboxypeptidase regulatory-like domain-containing protein n=1 Tax=Gimesia panareensis TaxID=2527978 RepID=A0A518FLB4_9PLAN|nr:carboxypeptidase-like regulatory domain-containing protein [Gimesia panareensis]QDV17152.1 hypothetical protein Pan153_17870 [Gimesia panareensis]